MGKNKSRKDQSKNTSHDSGREINESVRNTGDEIFYDKMFTSFCKKLDEINFSKRSSPSATSNTEEQSSSRTNHRQDQVVESNHVQQEVVTKKELELKELEIQLLKRENELLKRFQQQPTSDVIATANNIANQVIPLLFKDVEDSLNKFSGEDYYPIHIWLQDIDDAATQYRWSDQQKTIYAKRLLSGSAKLSLEFARDTHTWDGFCAHMNKEIKIKINSTEVHDKMRRRTKQPNESLRKYLLFM